ncbi:MAG: UDP-N-acetylmuramoyl-tripeptide--D-alanyl-D-alanine ligase [Candidatus Dojkabacteria bacterium]
MNFNPYKIIKYQLYLFQLEEYDGRRYLDAILHKGLIPTSSLRKELQWTLKAKLIFLISLILQIAVAAADSHLIGLILFNSTLVLIIILIFELFLVAYLSFIFNIVASWILFPLEYFQKQRLINQAKSKYQKLKTQNSELKTIGITGSFGKTTMKETLSTILSEKFKVVSTPENINTPIGLARVILSSLNESTEVFVVEMGEYVKGDVDALCQIAKPDISVITGINEAHLERYGSMKNAVDTKFEIVENTPEGGLVVLNGNDKLTTENYERFTKNKRVEWFNSESSPPVYLTNGKAPDAGGRAGKFKVLSSKFDIEKLVRRIEIQTPTSALSAQTNIIAEYIGGNILASMIVGTELGMSEAQIKLGITQLKPAPYRLEVKKNGDIVVIDDTYNGNSDGIKAGIKLLSEFTNRRKVYVTPGLVETGELKEEIHKEIGKQLASVADLVILTKNSATPFIAEGLKEAGFTEDKIVWYETSKETYEKLRENLQTGDVVMMQNDWSDNYF